MWCGGGGRGQREEGPGRHRRGRPASVGRPMVAALGEVAVAEAVAAGEALLERDAHGRVLARAPSMALDLEWPKRLGPSRGVRRPMQQDHALMLARALNMVRAMREARALPDASGLHKDEHARPTTASAHERGRILLRPSSCRYGASMLVAVQDLGCRV